MEAEHTKRPDGWMTCTAYAARRGVAKSTVSDAIRTGRVAASVGRDARGPYIADPDLADREWAANTDYSEAPASVVAAQVARAAPVFTVTDVIAPDPVSAAAPPTEIGNLQANNAAKAYWQAKRAELDYREAAAELVLAKDVDAKLQDVFRKCRSKLLGVPARARQQMPDLTTDHIAALEALVREALEDLAAEGEPAP